MSDSMTVSHLGADRFAIEIRGHTVTVDQPIDVGGDDTAPTPTELFIASLASCVAFYARRYLARHDIPTEGLSVTSSYTVRRQTQPRDRHRHPHHRPARAPGCPPRRVPRRRVPLHRAQHPARAPRGADHHRLRGDRMSTSVACVTSRGWPQQRILFLMAGTVTLTGVLLAVLVSPWFLLLPALAGTNQLGMVVAGWCPMSLVLTRLGYGEADPSPAGPGG